MKRMVVFLAWLGLLSGAAWGNGEEIRYDPNTGVILPAGPSPAQVEREQLEIEFQPMGPAAVREVRVRAQYWLKNPTDQPLKTEIGFPAPGSALLLKETPVRLDGRPVEWRLRNYQELLRPLQPGLIRAMQRWANRHPRAVELAGQMRELERQSLTPREKAQKRGLLWRQLRAELIKAGSPDPGNALDWVPTSTEAPKFYQNVWNLRRALLASGQRRLLPEGRWHVDPTVLDPVTGRQVWSREGYDELVSMLTFPLSIQPRGRHRLEVVYRQTPSREEGAYSFAYVLKTVRNWSSFGPIEVTVKAPAGLVFRSLPTLRYAGTSQGLRVYRGTLLRPNRNLQVALANREALLPRLKINGQSSYQHLDMLVDGVPTVPARMLGVAAGPRPERRMEQGELVLIRKDVTVRVRPGERRMLVNGEAAPLVTPVVVRKGTSFVPVEVIRALYPEYTVSLIYHALSRTVALGMRPKSWPAAPAAGQSLSPPGERQPQDLNPLNPLNL